MNSILRAIRFESIKILTSRTWWVITPIVVVFQGFIAFMTGIGYAQIGIGATPETEPSLLEPLPPIEYFGFEFLPFGEAVIVVAAAILSSAEYRSDELRTTTLAINKRITSLASKLLSLTALVALLALVSIIVTIVSVHVGIGSEGLTLTTLPGVTWKHITMSAVYWSLLALLTYLVGIATRSWIPPMALFLPQVLGLGDWLAGRWDAASYLPTNAGHCWSATPEFSCSSSSGPFLAALIFWVLVATLLTGVVYQRRDIGA